MSYDKTCRMLTRKVNKSPEHVMINCSFHLNHYQNGKGNKN